jgi:5'-phosphate synthase pdxT subunit
VPAAAARSSRTGTVGLLALQGDFDMHRQVVQDLGRTAYEVRTVDDLAHVDCLIMPGGESTTMRKLMRLGGLFEAIPQFAKSHPIMATCAGLILLSGGVEGSPEEETLGLIDCTVSRNSYGRQYHSFRQSGRIRLPQGETPFEMVFIRAPQIIRIGGSVEIHGCLGDEPTLIRQGNVLAMTFHPELSGDGRIHEFFLSQMA